MLSEAEAERTQRLRPRPGGNDLTAKPTPAAALGPLPSPRAPSGDTDRSSRLRAGQAEPEGLTSESSRHSLTPKSCQRPHGPLGCTHRISDRHALDGRDHQPSTRAWLPVVSTGVGGPTPSSRTSVPTTGSQTVTRRRVERTARLRERHTGPFVSESVDTPPPWRLRSRCSCWTRS